MTQVRRSLFGSYYSYKYNGKELQETGMYDYGARMMIPDLGRWGVMDAMSEKYSSWSPYNYAINNPVMVIDPDGNDAMFASGEAAQIAFKAYVATMSTSTETSGSNIFTGLGRSPGEDPDDPKANFFGRIGNFFRDLFGRNKQGKETATFATAGTLTRAGAIEIGEITFRGILSFDAVLAGITKVGLWSLPLTLKGDMPEKEQMVTLYRGVSSEAKGSMYFEAMQGIAIPNGFRQIATTWGPHRDMEAHAGGDNLSIWTSWSTSKESAKDFATGVAMYENGIPGIIMSKKFRVSEVVPNPYNPQEAEWLIPGVVYGAKVEYVLPRPK